jgi:lambda repressor-like predicted transcriptional regulator
MFLDDVREGRVNIVKDEFHRKLKNLMMESLLLPDPEDQETRNLAKDNGWLPFGVWGDLDNPDCEPEDPEHDHREALDKLRSLHARGFSVSRLAAEMNINRSTMGQILDNRLPIREDLCMNILDSYDRLSLAPDPQGYGASRSRNHAARRGWNQLVDLT